MVPALLSALIGGASALGGSVLSYAGQNHANAQALANVREQNAWQERMWHLANKYNDPSAQVERMKQAGINPAMALGSITPGVAQSMSAPAPAGAGNAGAELGRGISNAGQMALQAYQQSRLNESSIALQTAQADKLSADADRIRTLLPDEQKNIQEQTSNLKKQGYMYGTQAWLFRSQAIQNEELTEVKKNQILADIEVSWSKVRQTDLAMKIDQFNLDFILPEQRNQMRALTKQALAQTAYLYSGVALNAAQVSNVFQDTLLKKAQEAGVKLSNEQVKKITSHIDKDHAVERQLKRALITSEGKKVNLMDSQEDKNRVETFTSILNGIANGAKAVASFM